MEDKSNSDTRPKSFFDSLSEAGKELVPVIYRFVFSRSTGGAPTRLAESKFYRAKSLGCHYYHKPVSKVLPPNES